MSCYIVLSMNDVNGRLRRPVKVRRAGEGQIVLPSLRLSPRSSLAGREGGGAPFRPVGSGGYPWIPVHSGTANTPPLARH